MRVDRVGGGVASPVLSHHRANGSVPRRFLSPIIGLSFVPLNSLACVLWALRQSLGFRPAIQLSRALRGGFCSYTSESGQLSTRDRFSPSALG